MGGVDGEGGAGEKAPRPSDARAREPGLEAQRRAEIAEILAAGEWRGRATSAALAKKWGIGARYVRKLAQEARASISVALTPERLAAVAARAADVVEDTLDDADEEPALRLRAAEVALRAHAAAPLGELARAASLALSPEWAALRPKLLALFAACPTCAAAAKELLEPMQEQESEEL